MWMLGACTTFLIKQEVWYSLGNTARGSGMFFIISSLFVGLHHILCPFFAVATALFCRSCFICNTTPLYFVFGSLKLFSDIQNQWVLRDQGRPRSPRGNVHRWDGRKRKAPAIAGAFLLVTHRRLERRTPSLKGRPAYFSILFDDVFP